MPWQHYLTTIEGRKASVLLDDQFAATEPLPQLPHLVWIGVWCRMNPGAAFWHPDESDSLDRLEDNLLALCDECAHGWAVYVRCLNTPGIREYYFYAGEQAELERAVCLLLPRHLDYRIETERISDPEWRKYQTWLAEPREPLPKP